MADFDIDKYLEKQNIKEFDIDSYLSRKQPTIEPPDQEKLALAASPALTALAYNVPTGAQQAGKVVTEAIAPYLKEVGRGYVNKPAVAVADALLASGGIPPVVGPAMGAFERGKAIKEGAVAASKELSMGSPTSPIMGIPTSSTMGPYMNLYRTAPENVQIKLNQLMSEGGGNNAVKAFLNSPEGQMLQKTNPEFAKQASIFKQATPSALQQAGRLVRPLAVGAARVAGPVGTAMQVAEALPYMEQSQIGQRTQSGEIGQLMRGSRNMMLNQPTPQPLSPEEASNLIASGDQRLINIYGGEQALQLAIRKRAAQKALGR